MMDLVWRLRPSVHASPVDGGIHLRGWSGSLTVEGGADLWRLWQLLSTRLAAGCRTEELDRLSTRPELAAALHTLVGLLRTHDLLVAVPADWPVGTGAAPATADVPQAEVAGWLSAVAADPVVAWRRLATTGVSVRGDPAIATAAIEALRASGVDAWMAPDDADPALTELTTVDGRQVVAGSDASVGFSTPVGPAGATRRDAEAIARRLGLVSSGPAPAVPAALIGAAAAQRLVTAVAGLPEPDAPASDLRLRREPPRVLVIRTGPMRSTYHPWLGGTPATPEPTEPEPGSGRLDVETAGQRLEILCDPELGVLPVARTDDLSQVPLGTARCELDPGHSGASDVVVGHGDSSDLARLAAVLTTAEHLLDDGTGTVAVGVDHVHAEGVLLRRLLHQRSGDGRIELPEAAARPHPGPCRTDCADWRHDPVAGRWWRTLTVRYGVAARLDLRAIATGVHYARVYRGTDPLGWAVEATAADAVAFAAQDAVAAVHRSAGPAPSRIGGACGAYPARVVDRAHVPWYHGGWAWPDRSAAREPELQTSLRRLLGDPTPTPVRRGPGDQVLHALAYVGFVALEVPHQAG